MFRSTVVFGLEKPNILVLSYDYRKFKDVLWTEINTELPSTCFISLYFNYVFFPQLSISVAAAKATYFYSSKIKSFLFSFLFFFQQTLGTFSSIKSINFLLILTYFCLWCLFCAREVSKLLPWQPININPCEIFLLKYFLYWKCYVGGKNHWNWKRCSDDLIHILFFFFFFSPFFPPGFCNKTVLDISFMRANSLSASWNWLHRACLYMDLSIPEDFFRTWAV